jgi:hypothetical protein
MFQPRRLRTRRPSSVDGAEAVPLQLEEPPRAGRRGPGRDIIGWGSRRRTNVLDRGRVPSRLSRESRWCRQSDRRGCRSSSAPPSAPLASRCVSREEWSRSIGVASSSAGNHGARAGTGQRGWYSNPSTEPSQPVFNQTILCPFSLATSTSSRAAFAVQGQARLNSSFPGMHARREILVATAPANENVGRP